MTALEDFLNRKPLRIQLDGGIVIEVYHTERYVRVRGPGLEAYLLGGKGIHVFNKVGAELTGRCSYGRKTSWRLKPMQILEFE